MAIHMSDIPIIGEWTGKIGKINNILATPCNITPAIYVEAFFAAIPQMVWSLFKPDSIDSLYDRFGRPHHRGKKLRFRGGGSISSEIPVGKGIGRALFPIGALINRVGWYFIIVDAALDHAINWMSMAYQWSGCDTPYDCACEGIYPETDGFQPGGYRELQNWSWTGPHDGANVFITGVDVLPGFDASMSLSVVGEPSHNTPSTGSFSGIRLIRDDGHVAFEHGTAGFGARKGGMGWSHVKNNSGSTQRYTAQVSVGGGVVRLMSGRWQINQVSPLGFNWDP